MSFLLENQVRSNQLSTQYWWFSSPKTVKTAENCHPKALPLLRLVALRGQLGLPTAVGRSGRGRQGENRASMTRRKRRAGGAERFSRSQVVDSVDFWVNRVNMSREILGNNGNNVSLTDPSPAPKKMAMIWREIWPPHYPMTICSKIPQKNQHFRIH
jgi:hypothetical protein